MENNYKIKQTLVKFDEDYFPYLEPNDVGFIRPPTLITIMLFSLFSSVVFSGLASSTGTSLNQVERCALLV